MDTGYRIGYDLLLKWIHIFEMDRIPDWIQIFVKVDTGYRIGYEICLILMDTVSGTGYMYPDIPGNHSKTLTRSKEEYETPPVCNHQIF